MVRGLMRHRSFTTTQWYYRINPDRQSREYYAEMEFIDLKQ
jgi:hypothetical protein